MINKNCITNKCKILANFPFESKFVKVKNTNIHYVDVGQGDPILFLHGVPTSNYVWRNVIPLLARHARCIAPDLVGMGKSGKPNIEYKIADHIEYIKEFVDNLKLKNITIVMHGLGSIVGFDYLANNRANVKAIAFYEAYVCPFYNRDFLSLPAQHLFYSLADEKSGYSQVIESNFLLKNLLPSLALRKMHSTELAAYESPFVTANDRKPLWNYLQDLKLQTFSNSSNSLLKKQACYLQNDNIPKLMLYNIPGFITTVEMIKWCRDFLPNLQLMDLGDGCDLAQETNPDKFAEILTDWYLHLPSHNAL